MARPVNRYGLFSYSFIGQQAKDRTQALQWLIRHHDQPNHHQYLIIEEFSKEGFSMSEKILVQSKAIPSWWHRPADHNQGANLSAFYTLSNQRSNSYNFLQNFLMKVRKKNDLIKIIMTSFSRNDFLSDICHNISNGVISTIAQVGKPTAL